MSRYNWRPGMGQISGFGGSYETDCRAMLAAALKWYDEHPLSSPKFHAFDNVPDVIEEEDEDARSLSQVVINAACGRADGAQHKVVIGYALWIRRYGWDAFCAAMTPPWGLSAGLAS